MILEVFHSKRLVITTAMRNIVTFFSHYLRVTARSSFRDPGTTLTSILGLALGITCSMLILLYLLHEFSYNDHHTKAHRIYKVFESRQLSSEEIMYVYSTPGAIAPALVQELPEVENATRFMARRIYVGSTAKKGEGILSLAVVADNHFFDVFDFPLAKGDQKTGLSSPFSAFITQDLAHKIFGNDPAIGKSISLTGKLFDDTYTITGILKNIPNSSTSDLAPDFITTTRPTKNPESITNIWESWRGTIARPYILLRPDVSLSDFRKKLDNFVDRHTEEIDRPWTGVGLEIMKITDLHLYGKSRYDLAYSGDIYTCYILGCICVFIAIVTIVNFTNLNVTRLLRRTLEAGIRRALGASRIQLTTQVFFESICTSAIAGLLGLGIVKIILPTFNTFLATNFSIQTENIVAFLALPICVGGLAAIYPAWLLSSFSPGHTLVMRRGTGIPKQRTIQKTLVIIQLTVSMMLIVTTFIILQQTEFLRTSDLGFRQEAVMLTRRAVVRNTQALKTQLQQIAGVRGVSLSHLPLLGSGGDEGSLRLSGQSNDTEVKALVIDADFLNLYQIPIVAGRNITAQDVRPIPPGRGPFSFDSVILVNETGAKQLNAQVGDVLKSWGGSFKVIGIYKDFHSRSLHEPIEPLILYPGTPDGQSYISIWVDLENVTDVIAQIHATWKTFVPAQPFEYAFIDDIHNTGYGAEERLTRLCALSSGVAIAMMSFGLLGLISLTVTRRAPEIAIRKVLGATESNIIMLLLKEYLFIFCVSGLLAIPMSYHAMTWWLEDFPYRIQLGPISFFMGSSIALATMLLAIGWQAIKASRANPVDSLNS